MRLVSALYNHFYPFDSLSFIKDQECVTVPRELKKGDILVVWGGSDIHPQLYNHPRNKMTDADVRPSKRDVIEWALMQRAKELNIPIIGVCRGAQMLCALAGGALIQHVNGHGGSHRVNTADGRSFLVNSLHHQMMYPEGTNHNVVAWSSELKSNVYHYKHETISLTQEPEFIHFTDIKGFAVQWHPEMMGIEAEATNYLFEYIYAHL
jgi:putative glutamine amidotransferase